MVITKRTVITLSWMLVFLAAILLFFKIELTSNTLFLEDVARNLFLYHGSWYGWQFSPTPAYIPDVALYFIAFKILPLPTDRILFVTIAEVLLTAACAIWLARNIKKTLSTTATAAILGLVALTVLVSVHSNMIVFFNSTNPQIASLLFSLLALGFLLTYILSQQGVSLLRFLIAIIVAIVCDQLFIIGFYSTAIIVLLIYIVCLSLKNKLSQYKRYEIPLLKSLLVAIFAYPIAKMVLYFIDYDKTKLRHDTISYHHIMQSLHDFKSAIINIFQPFNAGIWLYTVLFLLSLIYNLVLFAKLFNVSISTKGWRKVDPNLKIRFVGKFDNPFNFCLIFLVFLIPVNFIGVIVSGNFHSINDLSYFILPVGLSFILSIVMLDMRGATPAGEASFLPQHDPSCRSLLPTKCGRGVGGEGHLADSFNFFSSTVYTALIAIFIAIIFTFYQQLHNQGWQRIKTIRQQGVATLHNEAAIADCLQQLQKVKKLHAGLANYWHGRGVSLRLAEYLSIAVMQDDLAPKTALNTEDLYLHPAKYNINYDFIMEKNGDLFTLNEISPFLPMGYEQHVCANAPVEIWTYRNGVLNTFIQTQINKFFFENDEISRFIWPASLFNGKVGQIKKGARIAIADHDK
ncbi:MAG: hypothetical protein ACK4PR_09280, partial [Gammaproteobacteria bacterium]